MPTCPAEREVRSVCFSLTSQDFHACLLCLVFVLLFLEVRCVFCLASLWICLSKNHLCFSGLEMEGYNLLVTSTIEMAVVYRSESENLTKISVVWSLGFADVSLMTVSLCVCLLRDVQDRGLSCPVCLSESDQWDAVLCALVIDLDFDGQKEVLLGTYGQVRSLKDKTGYSLDFLWLINSIKRSKTTS